MTRAAQWLIFIGLSLSGCAATQALSAPSVGYDAFRLDVESASASDSSVTVHGKMSNHGERPIQVDASQWSFLLTDGTELGVVPESAKRCPELTLEPDDERRCTLEFSAGTTGVKAKAPGGKLVVSGVRAGIETFPKIESRMEATQRKARTVDTYRPSSVP